MDARFLGPSLAEDRLAALRSEAESYRTAHALPANAGPRERVARLLVVVAIRLSPAIADAMPRRAAMDDAPAWWDFDAPRGVFC